MLLCTYMLELPAEPFPHLENGGGSDNSRKDRQVYLLATKKPKPLLIPWVWKPAKEIREDA